MGSWKVFLYYPAITREIFATTKIWNQEKMELRSVFRRMPRLTVAFANMFALSILVQLAGFTQPLFLQYTINEVIPTGELQNIVISTLIFLVINLLYVSLRSFKEVYSLNATTKLRLVSQTEVYQHLIRLPASYFNKRNSGEVMANFQSNSAILNSVFRNIPIIIVEGIGCVLTLVIVYNYDIVLMMIVLILTCFLLLVRALPYGYAHGLRTRAQSISSDVMTSFLESIRAFRTVKIFQLEKVRELQWAKAYSDGLSNDAETELFRVYSIVATDTATAVAYFVSIAYGVHLILLDDLDIGILVAFLAFMSKFVSSANRVFESCVQLKLLGVSIARLADILDEEPEQVGRDTGWNETAIESLKALHTNTPLLEIHSLSYRYSIAEPFVFENFNMTLSESEIVAVVGPSGRGKTTLLSCILQLLTASDGEIFFQGTNIRNSKDLRSVISAVLQDDTLFKGTIAENISCFHEEAPYARIVEAAMNAEIHDEILKMKDGYNTFIRDLGASFSGGQKQRILIARALFKRPMVLVLDEATSQIDLENERKILTNVRKLGCACIIVSHRAETQNFADRQVMLNSKSQQDVN